MGKILPTENVYKLGVEFANGQKRLREKVRSKFELCHCTEMGSPTAK